MGKYFYKKANQIARVPKALNGVTDTLANTIKLLDAPPILGKKAPRTTAAMGKIPGVPKIDKLEMPSGKNQMPKMAAKKLNPVSESYKYFRFVKKQTHDQSRINAAKARESGIYPDWVMNKMKKNLEETKKPKGPLQLSLFDKKASLMRKFFAHTTSKNSLAKILESGKIMTGKSLGEKGKSLRNIDDMIPDALSEYVSTGRDTIYSGNNKFRAIVMDRPKNKASNLRKETLFKGNVNINPKKVKVYVPKNSIASYKKQFPKYRFFASESVNPKSITAYQPSKNWGQEMDNLNKIFKTAKDNNAKIVKSNTKTKGRVKAHTTSIVEIKTPKGKRLYRGDGRSVNPNVSQNIAFRDAIHKSTYSPQDSIRYKTVFPNRIK
jgi:hypothetical protein